MFSKCGRSTPWYVLKISTTAHCHICPQDRYAEGNQAPVVDSSQDVQLLGGYQNDTHTVLRFSRLWNTCDETHDLVLSVRKGRNSDQLWACSPSLLNLLEHPKLLLSAHGKLM